MRSSTLVVLLCAAALMSPGCAGTPKAARKDPKAIVATFDQNRDDRISFNEFLSQIRDHKTGEKIFGELDTNGDGFISMDEAAAQSSLMQTAIRLTEPPK